MFHIRPFMKRPALYMSRVVMGPRLVRLFTLRAAAFLTSALSSPGWVTATRVTGSTVISRIRSVISTIPPSTALDPPDSEILPVTSPDAAEQGASPRHEIANLVCPLTSTRRGSIVVANQRTARGGCSSSRRFEALLPSTSSGSISSVRSSCWRCPKAGRSPGNIRLDPFEPAGNATESVGHQVADRIVRSRIDPRTPLSN